MTPRRRALGPFTLCHWGLVAVSLAACTTYVTVEEQGLVIPSASTLSPGASAKPGGSARAAYGEIERLTDVAAEDELFPTIAPDGSALLFHAETVTPSDKKVATQAVFALDPRAPKSARRRLSQEGRLASQPSFAPDGKSFVYVTNALGPLAIVRALSTEPGAAITVIIASDLAPEPAEPTISPDGQRVAFSMRAKDGSRAIGVVGIDGSRLTAVGQGRAPAWSPDGRHLAFVRTVKGHNHVLAVEAQTFAGETQLTSGDLDVDRPSYAPNGAFLVVSSNKDGGGSLGVFSVRLGDGAMTRLSAPAQRAATPVWGRDGFVYFSADEGKGFDIFRVKLSGELAAASKPIAAPKPPEPVVSTPTPSASPPSVAPSAGPAPAGCTKDTDCKADRVCDAGRCVEPKK